jgi:hypothetical protein
LYPLDLRMIFGNRRSISSAFSRTASSAAR